MVVDARNVWRASDVVRAGLRYQGIGVPSLDAPPNRAPTGRAALNGHGAWRASSSRAAWGSSATT